MAGDIWAAWLKVKSKGGAAGADGVTIEQFETRLKDNLYRPTPRTLGFSVS